MLDNISQLKKIDSQWLDQVVHELTQVSLSLAARGASENLPSTAEGQDLEALWREPYPEYGSAGLKVATLLNPTGEQENFDYRDCRSPAVTPLLLQVPTIHDFFKASGFQIMGSRLLRLDQGTFLHEHRDFVYLEEVPRFRLHIPLITNDRAFITSPGLNVHFERGYLWKLDPKETVHSACNFGSAPRIHLMLDCYVNEPLAQLLAGQSLDDRLKHKLPPFTKAKKDQLMTEARGLLAKGMNGAPELVTAAEEVLLRTFCQYDLRAYSADLTTYDLLFELYADASLAARKIYWQERLSEVYPPAQSQKESKEKGLLIAR
ncbi:MAG: aspartyl/asparaginyl beta-hydroxylase domain-containing protein [Cyanobacteria bacterium REEB67]|nr:aspartyl/asparaginyl beta-hydroxylase domain-containing protein [Cyanobacteria bacterium REEB67]